MGRSRAAVECVRLRSVLFLLVVSSAIGCRNHLGTAPSLGGIKAIGAESELDVHLALLLGTPGERRRILKATNPREAACIFWERYDPTPDSAANELLEVLRQRARYLLKRFPDVEIADIEQPWTTFLSFGLWDDHSQVGNEHWIKYLIPYSNTRQISSHQPP